MSEELALHPLCEVFPEITGEEFDALVADVKANGLREPIKLFDGQVLDGRNRYRACLAAGVEPIFTGAEFTGDIASYVLSLNLHRRQMSKAQSAAVVAKITDWSKANQRGGRRATDDIPEIPLATVADRAKAAGVSERTQRTADRVAKADETLITDVAQGKLKLSAAVAKLNEGKPKSERQLEAEQAQADAFEDVDPVAELEAAHKEIESLKADLAAIQTSSPQGELLKARRLVKAAETTRDEHMRLADEHKKTNTRLKRHLTRIGRLIGEDDVERVADAVEKVLKKAA